MKFRKFLSIFWGALASVIWIFDLQMSNQQVLLISMWGTATLLVAMNIRD